MDKDIKEADDPTPHTLETMKRNYPSFAEHRELQSESPNMADAKANGFEAPLAANRPQSVNSKTEKEKHFQKIGELALGIAEMAEEMKKRVTEQQREIKALEAQGKRDIDAAQSAVAEVKERSKREKEKLRQKIGQLGNTKMAEEMEEQRQKIRVLEEEQTRIRAESVGWQQHAAEAERWAESFVTKLMQEKERSKIEKEELTQKIGQLELSNAGMAEEKEKQRLKIRMLEEEQTRIKAESAGWQERAAQAEGRANDVTTALKNSKERSKRLERENTERSLQTGLRTDPMDNPSNPSPGDKRRADGSSSRWPRPEPDDGERSLISEKKETTAITVTTKRSRKTLPALTAEMERTIEKTFAGGDDVIVAAHGRIGLRLTRREWKSLAVASESVSPKLVDSYLDLIDKRSSDADVLPNPLLPTTWVFSTAYTTGILNATPEETMSMAEPFDASSYDMILFPVVHDAQWNLVAVDVKANVITRYDTAGDGNDADLDAIHAFVYAPYPTRPHTRNAPPFNLCNRVEAPRQMNVQDSAILTMKIADCVSRGRKVEFVGSDVPYLRSVVMWELVSGRILDPCVE